MLIEERRVCEQYLPALTKLLLASNLLDLEKSGPENVVKWFKAYGKPGLLVPKKYGGEGCPLEPFVHILRFIGSHYPSLALAMTMHHHTVGAFVMGAVPMKGSDDLLRRIAGGAVIASAFSEARSNSDILRSTVQFTLNDDGLGGVIHGEKKPVSMSHLADLVLVSVHEQGNASNRGLVLIDRAVSSIGVKDFWTSEILRSADNNCLVFDDIAVSEGNFLVPTGEGISATKTRFLIADGQIVISTLFQMMLCASYLGLASRICEMFITSKMCLSSERLDIMSRLESAAMAVYHVAGKTTIDNLTNQLCYAMLVTHNTINQMDEVVSEASGKLGEKGYLNNEEALYIVLSSKCIHYHPPSREYKQSIVDLAFGDNQQ